MAPSDPLVAFVASCFTLASAQADIRKSGMALGVWDPFTAQQAPLTRFRVPPTLPTEAMARTFPSLAFLYLAYKDYERTKNYNISSEASMGAASRRWKRWAFCGVIGLAVGSYSPYDVLLSRPLEQHLRVGRPLSNSSMRKIVNQWGNIRLGRGIILLGCFPLALWTSSIQ